MVQETPRYQESTKYEVWNRLIKRFDLIPSGAYKGYLDGIIVPVTVVDDLVAQYQVYTDTTVTAVSVTFTVPAGKKWTLTHASVDTVSAATWDYAALQQRPELRSVTLGSFDGTGDFQVLPIYVPVVMQENWILTFTGTTSVTRTAKILVKEEDAY